MSALEPKAAEAMRQILARWASSMPGNPVPDFGEKMFLVAAREKPAHLVELRTLYDMRSPIKEQKVPYKEGEKTTAGSKDVWAHAVSLPADYSEQETDVSFSASDSPDPCPTCNGDGRKLCEKCHGGKTMACPDCMGPKKKVCAQCGGLGKIACAQCGGKGQVLISMSGALREEAACSACAGTGGPKCDQCDNGMIDCARCKNSRSIECDRCAGKGGSPCVMCGGARQVVSGCSFHVTYRPLAQRTLVADPETPDGLLPADPGWKKLGDVVYELEGAPLKALEPAPPEMTRALLAEYVNRAQAAIASLEQPARILKQKIAVERIPAYEAVYQYGGKTYSCWATPLDGKVVSARDPFTELSAAWIGQAEQKLAEGAREEAAKLLAQAAPLRRDGWAQAVEKRLSGGGASGGGDGDGSAPLAAGVIFAASVALALTQHGSPHLFWPIAFFAAAAALLGWLVGRSVDGRLPESVPSRVACLIGPVGGSAIALVFFLLIGPVRRLDAAEFMTRLAGHIPPPESPLPPEDQAYLKVLIAEYEPLGVDVSSAKAALEADARRQAEAAAAEQARLDAAQQEKLIKAGTAKRRQQELAAKKKAAALAAKKKKKKKRSR